MVQPIHNTINQSRSIYKQDREATCDSQASFIPEFAKRRKENVARNQQIKKGFQAELSQDLLPIGLSASIHFNSSQRSQPFVRLPVAQAGQNSVSQAASGHGQGVPVMFADMGVSAHENGSTAIAHSDSEAPSSDGDDFTDWSAENHDDKDEADGAFFFKQCVSDDAISTTTRPLMPHNSPAICNHPGLEFDMGPQLPLTPPNDRSIADRMNFGIRIPAHRSPPALQDDRPRRSALPINIRNIQAAVAHVLGIHTLLLLAA